MDPNNSIFIKELSDGWDQYFDSMQQKDFYFNLQLGKRQWESPSVLITDSSVQILEYQTCLNCRGWGKKLIFNQGLCKRCNNSQIQVTSTGQQNINFQQMEAPLYKQNGPCEKCLGYGKLLVSQYGLCARCYRNTPNSKLEEKMQSRLQIQQTRIKEQETQQQFKVPKVSDLRRNQSQALQLLLSDLTAKEQIPIQESLQLSEFPENFKASINKKRPHGKPIDQVYNEAREIDPLDPMKGKQAGISNTIGSMSQAADETAEGALFQSRPYPNPRKVLQTMEKKKNMN